jgi:DAK2 domain
LTLTWLDEELERLWTSPADTPAYRKGQIGSTTDTLRERNHAPARTSATAATFIEADDPARACGAHVADAIVAIAARMSDAEAELGRIDAVAGDGDHGRGMVRGTEAARAAATSAARRGGGTASVLVAAGEAWAAKAGGTSGCCGAQRCPRRAAGWGTVVHQPTPTWPTHCARAMTRSSNSVAPGAATRPWSMRSVRSLMRSGPP